MEGNELTMNMGKHGITTQTPENIPFGAGTYHKNLQWNAEKSAWEGTCIGATSGGGKLSIAGEYVDLELDGALVNWKGQTIKQGGKASMEVTMAEFTGDNIKMVAHFKEDATSEVDGFVKYVDKPELEEGDYVDNFAFVGKTATGRPIIVIFESSLCKSALELEPKNKENATFKATMEAYAENEGDLDTLPVAIYYPTVA